MLAVQPALELVRAVPALLGVAIVGSGSGRGGQWALGAAVLIAAIGTLRWLTTSYRITPDQVQLRRGLLRRRVLSVARDRVRTVDVTASPLHRAVGLARVRVGTGHGGRSGERALTLDGLKAAEAARLRGELLHRAAPAPPAPDAADAAADADAAPVAERELARLDPAWIRFGPFTLSGVAALAVAGALAARFASEAHLEPEDFGILREAADHVLGAPAGVAIAEVAAVLAVVVALLSTGGYVLSSWGFSLTRHAGGTLHVRRGLLTTRAVSIEERRMRGVEVAETLLLRVPGGARCTAIATGLRPGGGAERGGALLLPPAPRAEAVRVAGLVLGDPGVATAPLTPHGPAARRRRFARALTPVAAAAAALLAADRLAGWPAWPWIAALALLPAAALLAADRARSLGHALAGPWLVVRRGSIVRRRSTLARDGIIGWTVRRSFFQRRMGLATLTATTAAGRQRYAVLDVDEAEALRLARAATPGLLDPFLAAPPGDRYEAASRSGAAAGSSAGSGAGASAGSERAARSS